MNGHLRSAAAPPVMSETVSFQRFEDEVIDPGLCTHCGTCVGLSKGGLGFVQTDRGPVPQPNGAAEIHLPQTAWEACPGRGLAYPTLNQAVFGHPPDSWLAGNVVASFIGYSANPAIRRAGASGGLITHILAEMVADGLIDGAVVLRHGYPKPWMSSPIIAMDRQGILASSQSVYVPTPVNTILHELESFEGRVGFVGLPDQVASIRKLQQLGHPAARKIEMIIGPYVGTALYLSAIRSFLHTHGGYDLDDVAELRYREGEWPGHLAIRTVDGRELTEGKFYYNYLIPFFITNASLLSMDFTNELADISVGDAWSPALEVQGQGYSVVLARSERARQLLEGQEAAGKVHLEPVPLQDALRMHAHMLDFKKRGAYIRGQLRKTLGLAAPAYGVRPIRLPWSRYAVELIVSGLFVIGGTRVGRWLMERIPARLLGPVFESLRRWWKALSKSTKRKGIWTQQFEVVDAQRTAGANRG